MQGVLRMVVKVLEAGFEDHILLSHDGLDETLLARSGGPGYAMAVTMFIPQLRKAGANNTIVHQAPDRQPPPLPRVRPEDPGHGLTPHLSSCPNDAGSSTRNSVRRSL